jgi:hypothetical protein
MEGWTVIGRYYSVAEAYIAKGLLENENIPVIVTNATISTIYPMTDTWASVELLVPDACADAAKTLLESR